MCNAIYIGNTQQNFNKITDVHFSNLQRLLKNGHKSDSFAAHFVQHFNTTTAPTDIHKYIVQKVINQKNLIGAIKIFTKPNYNLCMQERLIILKKLCDQRITVMNKNMEIYKACQNNKTVHLFSLKTDHLVFNR